MKTLYKFTIPRVIKSEKTEIQEDGSKLIKTIDETVEQKFAIAKPNRVLLDEGEYFYNQKYNEYIKGGILPEILLRKLYGNENGIFTEQEKSEYVDLYIELGNLLSKIKELESSEVLTDENKAIIEESVKRKQEIHKQISSFENVKQSVFENSAESLARNKVVFWWLLVLLLKEKNGEYTRMFEGDSFDARASIYDALTEEIDDETEDGKFYSKLIERASFLVSLFFMNGTVKSEEFEQIVVNFDGNADSPPESEE